MKYALGFRFQTSSPRSNTPNQAQKRNQSAQYNALLGTVPNEALYSPVGTVPRREYRVFWVAAAVLFLIVLAGSRKGHAQDTYVAPEFDLYVTHSNALRSHFILSGNWLVQEGAFSSAWYQYDLDIGLGPFFRKYVFKDVNSEKGKRYSFRVGYLQVSDLKSDPNGFDEKRPFGELLYRLPAGQTWLFEDRNRGEYRGFTHSSDYWRYRNRLRIERNVVVKKLRMTPYTSGELFYTGHDGWNEVQAAIGIDLPWRNSTVWEFECMTQFVNGTYNTLSFGIMLQKYISWAPSRQ
jgi:hypothetical protein